MSVQIKICGLSTPETIDAAVDSGATHLFTAGNPDQREHFERAGFKALGPEEVQPEKGLPFIPKPYSLPGLLKAVRDTIEDEQ